MKVHIFLSVKAVISLIIAVLLLFVPSVSADWFGLSLSDGGTMMMQLLGAFLLGIALICFFSSRSESALTVRNMMLSLAVLDTLAFFINLFGQINGLMNSAGIVFLVLWALFAIGAWVYYFKGSLSV